MPMQISPGRGVLQYLTRRDVPLNRVSFHGKDYATGYLFLINIVLQGATIDKKIMRQGIVPDQNDLLDQYDSGVISVQTNMTPRPL